MHHLCLFETSSFLRNKYSLIDWKRIVLQDVIKIQTTQILAGSDLNYYKDNTTEATSGNLSRRRSFWDDEDTEE